MEATYPPERSKVQRNFETNELLSHQHGILTRKQALDLGYSASMIKTRLASGDWEVVHQSVYRSMSFPNTAVQSAMAACLALGDRVEALPECDLTTVQNVPTTNATRTLVDLGSVVEEEVVELALEDALRRELTSVPRLRWRIEELCKRGRRGCATLRRLLEVRGTQTATASPLETRLARLIRNSDLPPPMRQFEVRDGSRIRARVDFAYPQVKVAVEAGSYRWHSGRSDWERELQRRNFLQGHGWTIVHVTDKDIRRDPGGVLAQIRQVLRESGHPALF
ncbi:MAG: DUF559 domain-containing protein [Actinomycetota bacterium]|nr:DUF559 domain-containing protein [Actinomycetota bacterium]